MHIYFGKYEQLQSTEMNNTQTLKQKKEKELPQSKQFGKCKPNQLSLELFFSAIT